MICALLALVCVAQSVALGFGWLRLRRAPVGAATRLLRALTERDRAKAEFESETTHGKVADIAEMDMFAAERVVADARKDLEKALK